MSSMDLHEQLKQHFPDHVPSGESKADSGKSALWMQDAPLICKYEKRKGKPVTLIEGYTGAEADFKSLTKSLKTTFSTGGSHKKDVILIQGDFREKIMEYLRQLGFKVKRVGG